MPTVAAASEGMPPTTSADEDTSGDDTSGGGSSASLPGDYNNDYVVNAADYTVWRDTLGSTTDLRADDNGDLVVDQLDYEGWKQHFGEKALPGAFSITFPAPPALSVNDLNIQWEASAGADGYLLEISGFPDGSAPFFSQNLTSTLRFVTDLDEGTYYFSVTATNAAGTTTASNNHYQVVIDLLELQQTIFVTAQQYSIDFEELIPPPVSFFGSAAAADYHVTNIASQIGLVEQPWDLQSIHFRAILSEAFVDADIRAVINDYPFVNVHGDVVAMDEDQLWSGNHLAPILDQNGNAVGPVPVWTGSTGEGEWSGFTAEGWSNPFSPLGATVGVVGGAGGTWLDNGTRASNLGARLYGVGFAHENNIPPTVVAPIADQTLAAGTPLSLSLAAAFDDVTMDDTLDYYARQASGSALPSWLSLNTTTGLLTGTPTAAQAGTIVIDVTAVDNGVGTVTDQFQLTVTA
jgi:hypothetical protein